MKLGIHCIHIQNGGGGGGDGNESFVYHKWAPKMVIGTITKERGTNKEIIAKNTNGLIKAVKVRRSGKYLKINTCCCDNILVVPRRKGSYSRL